MTPWTCTGCQDPQLALVGAEPPGDGLCYGCRARQRPPVRKLLADAGVPPKFARHLSRAEWAKHFRRLDWTLDWPRPDVRWLCLWGPTGTGKTSAATILLAEHLQAGGRGLWIDGMSFLAELGREMDGGERVILQRLSRTPFLVFDEPFGVYLTDYVAGQVLLLIRARDQQELVTVVTSQLDPQALMVRASATRKDGDPLYPTGALGAAVSRVVSGLVVRVDGDDERIARAEEGEL